MDLEELAFKDVKELAYLQDIYLLQIIDFLQKDRKECLNQFAKTHNESVEILKENKQLKDNWNKLKEFMSYENIGRLFDMGYDANDFINEIDGKIKELEQGSASNE